MKAQSNAAYRTPYFKLEYYDRTLRERLAIWWQRLEWTLRELRREFSSLPAKQGSRYVECSKDEATWTFTTIEHPLRFKLVDGEYTKVEVSND